MASRSSADSSGSVIPSLVSDRSSSELNSHGGLHLGANLRRSVSPWVSFTWKTSILPGRISGELADDQIRCATSEESGKVLDALTHSFSMDSAWNDSMVKVKPYLRDAVARIFDQEEPLCLVMPKGNRFIAVSLLDTSKETSLQLLSGPAVLVEYRNRGLGTQMLYASLALLRDRGFSTVRGVTRANGVAARHVYTKFGSISEAGQLSVPAENSPQSKS